MHQLEHTHIAVQSDQVWLLKLYLKQYSGVGKERSPPEIYRLIHQSNGAVLLLLEQVCDGIVAPRHCNFERGSRPGCGSSPPPTTASRASDRPRLMSAVGSASRYCTTSTCPCQHAAHKSVAPYEASTSLARSSLTVVDIGSSKLPPRPVPWASRCLRKAGREHGGPSNISIMPLPAFSGGSGGPLLACRAFLDTIVLASHAMV